MKPQECLKLSGFRFTLRSGKMKPQ
ncbi:hypothetical protein A31O_01227, partial [Escherichia coli KTE170]